MDKKTIRRGVFLLGLGVFSGFLAMASVMEFIIRSEKIFGLFGLSLALLGAYFIADGVRFIIVGAYTKSEFDF